jgi:hypothetical protein
MADDSIRQSDQHTQNWSSDGRLRADKHLEGSRRDHRESSSSCSTTADLSPKATSMQGDAQVYIPSHGTPSIYGLYSPRRRNTILLAAAFTSILVPFSDTIYLPALAVSCCCQRFLQPTLCCHTFAKLLNEQFPYTSSSSSRPVHQGIACMAVEPLCLCA